MEGGEFPIASQIDGGMVIDLVNSGIANWSPVLSLLVCNLGWGKGKGVLTCRAPSHTTFTCEPHYILLCNLKV